MQYKLQTSRHAKHLLHAHLVFRPKYRKKIFTKEHLVCMQHVFDKVCQDFGAELVEFDGEQDHVHLFTKGGYISLSEQPQGRLQQAAATTI